MGSGTGATLNQNGESAMISVFDIGLVESGHQSLIYAHEDFP